MYGKLNYPKSRIPRIQYQFYRLGNKEDLNFNNKQNNYRCNMNCPLNDNCQLNNGWLKNQQGKKISNHKMNNQIDEKANNTMMDEKQINKNPIKKNRVALKRKKELKKKIVLGGLVVRAGLGYLYPKDVEVLYGMLLANKKLLSIKPELSEECQKIGKGLKKLKKIKYDENKKVTKSS